MEEKLLKTAKDDVFLQIARDLLVAYAEVGKGKSRVEVEITNKGLAGYLCDEFFALYDSLKKEYLKRL
jgi:hypothetical protein